MEKEDREMTRETNMYPQTRREGEREREREKKKGKDEEQES